MEQTRLEQLNDFCNRLNIKFNDLNLLDLAFRHRSATDNTKDVSHMNNERLEFLGDAVLELGLTYLLYRSIAESEKGLSKIKSAAVSEVTLAKIANKYNFNDMLILGKGEELSKGRVKPSILADSVEAILGAYFLDNGFNASYELIAKLFTKEIELIREEKFAVDYKTKLQEYCQANLQGIPKYVFLGTIGEKQDLKFQMKLILPKIKLEFGPINAVSKKQAQHILAKMAVDQIQNGRIKI